MIYWKQVEQSDFAKGYMTEGELLLGQVEITKEEFEALVFEPPIDPEFEAERVKEEARAKRAKEFAAFDIYKSNLEYGLITESSEEHQEILDWYQAWCNLPETITPESYNNIVYPLTPLAVAKYLTNS